MDIQEDFLNMQIAYEKNCAVRCNCSYEELKAQLDKSESLFGTRYLEGSPRHENWLLWVQAWQAAKAQAVPETQQALNDRLLVKSIREHVESHIAEVSVNDLFDKGWLAAMKCIQNNIDMLEAQELAND